jgi:hypothetical protein
MFKNKSCPLIVQGTDNQGATFNGTRLLVPFDLKKEKSL